VNQRQRSEIICTGSTNSFKYYKYSVKLNSFVHESHFPSPLPSDNFLSALSVGQGWTNGVGFCCSFFCLSIQSEVNRLNWISTDGRQPANSLVINRLSVSGASFPERRSFSPSFSLKSELLYDFEAPRWETCWGQKCCLLVLLDRQTTPSSISLCNVW